MKSPNYIQIDGSMFGDSKIAVLLRRHGAVGLAVYLYSLIQINQSNVDSLHLDEGFTECASVVLDITKETLGKVIETLIGIGLLICDGEAYYSHGYTKRTGEYKEANRKRSEAQKRNKAAEREGKEAEPVVLPPQPKPKRSPVPFPRSIISEIVDYWNATATAMKCNKITKDVTVAIAKREEYGLDEIKATICNYHKVLQDKECFFNYAWNIVDFFNRKNGFPSFVGGDEIVKRYKTTNDDEQIAKEQDSVKRHF